MADDVYTSERQHKEHSERYVHVVVRNVLGIINRITSLMRRKRFFINDISVAFDSADLAHIVISVDAAKTDIEQVMRHLEKLHDVTQVSDVTDRKNQFFHVYYVTATSKAVFDTLPGKSVQMLQQNGHWIGIFTISLDESPAFAEILKKGGYVFRRRILTVV